MKGSSLRVGREPAEAFTGNSAVVADLGAARLTMSGEVTTALHRAKHLPLRRDSYLISEAP